MQSITINHEKNNQGGYFWLSLESTDENVKNFGAQFASLAASGDLVISDASNLNKQMAWITDVSYVVPTKGKHYIKMNFEYTRQKGAHEGLNPKNTMFAFHYIREVQNITIVGDYNLQQTSTIYSYRHCLTCKYVGFKNRNDPTERNYGPFFEISKLFMRKTEIAKYAVQDLRNKE